MMDPKHKASIARILVGAERGTGFLVSEDGLVLTALHCVAYLPSPENPTLEWRKGTILLRFGDPREKELGPHDDAGELFTTEATVVGHSIEHDIALLQCTKAKVPNVPPLALAPVPFDAERWSTFGFAAASGALGDDPVEVVGQVFDGTITGGSSVLQLTLGQNVSSSLGGISGAPILVGDVVIGVARQTVNEDGKLNQNSLIGVLVESFVRRFSALKWIERPHVAEKYLRAMLSELNAKQLVLAAGPLGIPEHAEGLEQRTIQNFLTCSLRDASDAIDQIAAFVKVPPGQEYLRLLLCCARIPEHVARIAGVALEKDRPAPASLRVGAHHGTTARCLAFRFALDIWGTNGNIVGAIVDLGVLPGAENFEAAAKVSFRQKMLDLMEVAASATAKFETRKAAWVERRRDVYVVAEVGFPTDLAELLRPIYPRVRVIFRGAPPIAVDPANGGPITVPECVSPELEDEFGMIFEELT